MTIEILRVFKFLVELAVKIIEAKSNTWKHSSHGKTLRNSELFAVTMFPFLDESKLEEGKFENMAYGSLQEALEENHKKKICWLGMYAPINGCGWHKAVRLAKKIKEKETFFLLEEYLGLRDIFGVIGTYVRIATRCLISNKVQKRLFFYRDPVTGLRVNLWEAFKKDYLSSFMGKVLISGIANYKAFSNFTQDLPEHAKVVYFAELHGWEKALNLACKEKKDVTCVGLQHTIVPLLLLTYFNHSQELKDQGYIKNTPLPDRLGCVGEITRDIFLQNHWPEKKLFISGGFRFRGFKNDNGAQKLKKQKRNQIIVAFSISPIENQEMFLLLLDAFKDKDPEFTVLFKSHPCESVEKMARDMHLAIDNRIFKFTDRPLDEIVPESKAMIVKQSSAAFWAIDNNIPVIIPHLYSLIDLCPLSGITDLGIYVKNANELFDACKKVILTSGDINADSYAGFLKRYLRFYSENKQYYESLATA
jgi:surface carbohydrate biosynthesis protein (TIGR04326 family)